MGNKRVEQVAYDEAREQIKTCPSEHCLNSKKRLKTTSDYCKPCKTAFKTVKQFERLQV